MATLTSPAVSLSYLSAVFLAGISCSSSALPSTTPALGCNRYFHWSNGKSNSRTWHSGTLHRNPQFLCIMVTSRITLLLGRMRAVTLGEYVLTVARIEYAFFFIETARDSRVKSVLIDSKLAPPPVPCDVDMAVYVKLASRRYLGASLQHIPAFTRSESAPLSLESRIYPGGLNNSKVLGTEAWWRWRQPLATEL